MTVNSFFDRRRFLCGGGVTLGLPLLDALKPKRAHAAGPGYAVFLVAMNGVQQAYMNEPERFWPSNTGTLTTASMMADASRAISELAPHASYLNVVKGINFAFRGNGCGHTGGGNQVLTAAQVSSDADFSKNKSLAMGPSVDYRIAKDLSDKEPLALYAGSKNGYIHDHVSHRGAKDLIVAESNPWISYSKLMGVNTGGGDTAVKNLVLTRRKSVNDLIRAECKKLLSDKSLSTQDRQRMDRHLSSVRDIEQQLIATVTDRKSVV